MRIKLKKKWACAPCRIRMRRETQAPPGSWPTLAHYHGAETIQVAGFQRSHTDSRCCPRATGHTHGRCLLEVPPAQDPARCTEGCPSTARFSPSVFPQVRRGAQGLAAPGWAREAGLVRKRARGPAVSSVPRPDEAKVTWPPNPPKQRAGTGRHWTNMRVCVYTTYNACLIMHAFYIIIGF